MPIIVLEDADKQSYTTRVTKCDSGRVQDSMPHYKAANGKAGWRGSCTPLEYGTAFAASEVSAVCCPFRKAVAREDICKSRKAVASDKPPSSFINVVAGSNCAKSDFGWWTGVYTPFYYGYLARNGFFSEADLDGCVYYAQHIQVDNSMGGTN